MDRFTAIGLHIDVDLTINDQKHIPVMYALAAYYVPGGEFALRALGGQQMQVQ
jgi:hypothetical protein